MAHKSQPTVIQKIIRLNEGKKVKATQRPKKKEEKKQQPSLPPYFTGRGGR